MVNGHDDEWNHTSSFYGHAIGVTLHFTAGISILFRFTSLVAAIKARRKYVDLSLGFTQMINCCNHHAHHQQCSNVVCHSFYFHHLVFFAGNNSWVEERRNISYLLGIKQVNERSASKEGRSFSKNEVPPFLKGELDLLFGVYVSTHIGLDNLICDLCWTWANKCTPKSILVKLGLGVWTVQSLTQTPLYMI